MMRLLYNFYGGSPHIRKYQIGASWSATVPGVPCRSAVIEDASGIQPATTTECIDGLGVTLDVAATRRTSQQTDGSDPSVYVSVSIQPGAVYQAVLSGNTASSQPLTIFTETAGSSTGATVTAGIGTAYDDGYLWGYSGANTQSLRKMEAVDGSTATIEIPFRFDIASGDQFLAVTFGPGENVGIGLTNRTDEVDASLDNQSETNFRCVDLFYKDSSGNGVYESLAHVIMADHIYSGNMTETGIAAVVIPS